MTEPTQDERAFDGVRQAWSRRKWPALAVASLFAAVGVTAALSLPPVYRATANVIVDQDRGDAAASSDMESRLQLVNQHLLSRSRLETLIREMGLYPKLRRRAPMEVVVDRMRRDIHTEPKVQPTPSGIGTTLSFAVSYRGMDPQVVTKVANALAAFYVAEELKERERQNSGTVQTLKAQVEEVKRNLEEQERELGAGPAGLPLATEAGMANVERLQGDLRTASEERFRALDRRNDLLKELAEAESPRTVPGGPDPLRPAAMRLAKKKEALDELSRTYSEKYPDVIRLKEDVAALEEEAKAEAAAEAAADAGSGAVQSGASSREIDRVRSALQVVEVEIRSLRADEARYRAEIDGHIRKLEDAPRLQRSYQERTRDHQTTRDLYDSVRKRYEQALLEENDPARPARSRFRVLDPAVVPINPVAPNRFLLVFMALVGAAVLAAATVALAERLDTSLHTVDDLRSFTRVPVVASIPRIAASGDLRGQRRRVALATISLLLVLGVVVNVVHDSARTKDGLALMLAKGRP